MDNRDKLIEEHTGLIKSIVTSYTDGTDEDRWDDLYGAAMLGAAMAVDSFEESKAASLTTHIKNCCKNAIVDELRKIKRWDNELAFSKLATGDDDDEGEDSPFDVASDDAMWGEPSVNPEDDLLHTEELAVAQARVAAIVSTLTEREQYILFNHILEDEPETLRAIADEFKCSKDSILRDKQRLLNTLRLGEEA